MRHAAAALAVILAFATPGAALAQCPKTTRGDIEDEVMCPVCGTSLATSGDAPLAVQQRRLVARLVDDCRGKEEIKDALVAEYGESVLAVPEQEGFGLTTYLVPALVLLGGAAGAIAMAIRWRRRPAPAPAAAGQDPDDAARLEADLRRYDS